MRVLATYKKLKITEALIGMGKYEYVFRFDAEKEITELKHQNAALNEQIDHLEERINDSCGCI